MGPYNGMKVINYGHTNKKLPAAQGFVKEIAGSQLFLAGQRLGSSSKGITWSRGGRVD